MTDNILRQEPNPGDVALYWNQASLRVRTTVLDRAMQRAFSPSKFPIEVRHGLALKMDRPWAHLTEQEQEFLYLGLYDGIDCDMCGDYIPDVNDAKDRLFVTRTESTVCERCFNESEKEHAESN